MRLAINITIYYLVCFKIHNVKNNKTLLYNGHHQKIKNKNSNILHKQ